MTIAQLDVALDRPLPQSPDAERAVLGSILTNANAYYRVIGILGADDFFKDAHRIIFAAMRRLAETTREIDTLTVKEELINGGKLDHAGGHAYVSSLDMGAPDVANVERYASIVKRYANKRRDVVRGNATMRRGMDPDEEPEETAAWELRQLATEASGEHQSRSMYDASLDVARRRQQSATDGVDHVIRTTFPLLDRNMVFRRKRLHLICAPSSHGKSAFMRCLMVGMLRSALVRVAYYSLEESDDDVQEPLISHMSGVMLDRIQDRVLNDTEQHRVTLAVEELASWKARFFFADKLRSFDEIHADCRRLKAMHGLDAVFIDYAQLMSGFEESRSGEQEVNRIGRGLHRMAQDMDLCVSAGSQVNKEREKRASGRLALSDTAYGKVLGEHAGASLMFQCPRQDDASDADTPWCSTVFQVAKNRGRKKCDVPMHADMPTQTFGEGTCEENRCRWAKRSDGQMKLEA